MSDVSSSQGFFRLVSTLASARGLGVVGRVLIWSLLFVGCVETRTWRAAAPPWSEASLDGAQAIRVRLVDGQERVLGSPRWVSTPEPTLVGSQPNGESFRIPVDTVASFEVSETGSVERLGRGLWGTTLLVAGIVVAIVLIWTEGRFTF